MKAYIAMIDDSGYNFNYTLGVFDSKEEVKNAFLQEFYALFLKEELPEIKKKFPTWDDVLSSNILEKFPHKRFLCEVCELNKFYSSELWEKGEVSLSVENIEYIYGKEST